MLGGPLAEIMTADSVLSPYMYVFYVAFAVSFVFTPIMRVVAMHFGVIDQPDGMRKMHRIPVAYLGGIAVFLGWLAGLALATFLNLHRVELNWPDHLIVKFSIVAGACVIVILGLWDDIRGVNPSVKIAGQVFAALCLIWDGVGTRCMAPFLLPASSILTAKFGLPPIPETAVVLVSCIFVVVVVVGCCNATNLMDGLDGLCGGVTAIVAGGFLALAVSLAMFGGGLNVNMDGLRVVLGLALLGGVLGFIPYNFNPASIFMGDTGSMFLGFCCAVLIIVMGEGQHPKWFLASMVIFALPILDTGLAFARRWVNRRPLFSADKFHIHHQLVSRGFSVKQTVLLSYGLSLFFAILGVSIIFMRTRYVFACWMVIFGSIIVAAYKMGMIHESARPSVPRGLPDDSPETASTGSESAILEIPEADARAIEASVARAGGHGISL